MIVFDLKCSADHVFEAWFGDSAEFESQRKRKLVGCPLCGDTDVSKAVMAPNVGAKSNQKSSLPARRNPPGDNAVREGEVVAAGAPGPSPEQMKAVLERLAKLQSYVESNFDNVGKAFPEEVRKIHYGEADPRGIYGDASPEEVRALLEEGVEIAPLPFRSKKQLNG